MTDPSHDPLAALLALSVAERFAALERLADSLAGEADGARQLKKLRSVLDRRLRAQSRRDPPSRGWR
jgi:hypothetical protein